MIFISQHKICYYIFFYLVNKTKSFLKIELHGAKEGEFE